MIISVVGPQECVASPGATRDGESQRAGAARQVVRGVVLTRPTPGLEERAQSTQALQELVKWLPPDLFLTCLSRVRASVSAPPCPAHDVPALDQRRPAQAWLLRRFKAAHL